MSEKMIFNCSYGNDNAERATLPFIAANIAAIAGQDAVVLCTIEAARLGTVGGTEGIAAESLPVLKDLYAEFVSNGGEVWLCAACTKVRGITEENLAPGTKIASAAAVVEEIVNGAKTVAFA